jgi:hypothetical protein
VLDEGGWLTPLPGRFTSGNNPVPIVQEAGWARRPVWKGAANFAPTGIFFFCILSYSVCTSTVLVFCLYGPVFCFFCLFLQHTTQTSMPLAGFEPEIPAGERPPGSTFDPRTLQPVASRYTDWAIPAHRTKVSWRLKKIARVHIARAPRHDGVQGRRCLQSHTGNTSSKLSWLDSFIPRALQPLEPTETSILYKWMGKGMMTCGHDIRTDVSEDVAWVNSWQNRRWNEVTA